MQLRFVFREVLSDILLSYTRVCHFSILCASTKNTLRLPYHLSQGRHSAYFCKDKGSTTRLEELSLSRQKVKSALLSFAIVSKKKPNPSTMKLITNSFILAALALAACQPSEDKTTETTEETKEINAAATFPAYFEQVLQAHGGLEKWQQFGGMQYELQTDLGGNPATETHIIDLKTRKDLVKGGDYTIGYDGQQVWVSPTRAAYPGKSARFYHNLFFYFYTIPFVLADPGVNYEQLDDLELEGKTYLVIGTSFGQGIGDTPEDQYRMLINPETNQMEWLLYTVTYFGSDNVQFNALKYEDYQEQQGLLLPGKLTGYKYENGQIGDVRYQVSFNNVQLMQEQPAAEQFTMPANAEVDSLGS